MEREEFREALEKFPKVRDKDYKASDAALAASAEAPSSGVSREVERQQPGDSERLSENKALSVAAGLVAEEATGSAQRRAREAPVGTAPRPQAERSFWKRLEEVVAHQLPEEDAKKFCSRFRSAHKELVEHRLSLDAIERIVERWGGDRPGTLMRRARNDEVEQPP